MRNMTLTDIKALDREWLNVSEVAEVLGTDPQGIRIAAHENPRGLGFPVIVIGRNGRRVKVPRLPFIRYMEAGI